MSSCCSARITLAHSSNQGPSANDGAKRLMIFRVCSHNGDGFDRMSFVGLSRKDTVSGLDNRQLQKANSYITVRLGYASIGSRSEKQRG